MSEPRRPTAGLFVRALAVCALVSAGAGVAWAQAPQGVAPGGGIGGLGAAPEPGAAPSGSSPLGSAPLGAAPSAPGSVGPGGVVPPVSLQNQLGAIPLVSPRAGARTPVLRTVRVTQFTPDKRPLGEPIDLVCPEAGCQLLLPLVVNRDRQNFLADIQFVSQGAYLALESRSAAVGSVVEYGTGRAGPVFLKGPPDKRLEKRLSFVVAPPPSVRALDGTVGGRAISSGTVYTRKLEPDLVLVVDISPPRPAN